MQPIVRELAADEYQLWDRLVAMSPQRSIFSERWWIDIVTHGEARLLGCFMENLLIGGLPIWPCTAVGITRLRQPPLTPYWGPVLHPRNNETKYAARLSSEHAILRAFAEELLRWPDVTMQFHPSLTNWLPFFWSGYTQLTRYTYRIPDCSNTAALLATAEKSMRRGLRTAEECGLTLRDTVEPMVIAEVFRRVMERQGLRRSDEVLHVWLQLAEAARERNRLFTTAAIDSTGNVHSADAMVWDDRYAYAILGGTNPRYRKACGGTLTTWHLLETASPLVPAFDFEGSTMEAVEHFFRSFGSEQTPYFMVTRHSSWQLNAMRTVQQVLCRGKQALSRLKQQTRSVDMIPRTPIQS